MNSTPDNSEPLRSSGWLAVSFGGGTNSTAMLCGFRERGIRPDVIIFADTGGELPHTYEHVAMMNVQAQVWWGVEIQTCRATRKGAPITLEQDCANKGLLPSISYGRRSCSQRLKHEPMEKLLAKLATAAGVSQVVKAIGYDAGERNRGKNAPATGSLSGGITERYWYPLREWGWAREECAAAIARNRIEQPGKSACFFCAAMKPREVIALRDNHPEYLARALAMEQRAQARHRQLVGLGGSRNLWANWLANDAAQAKLWLDDEPFSTPCGCYDGESCAVSANNPVTDAEATP